ncbi:MAG: BTAD domain-containing putative transcriptional regulator [Roseiflexaceae bacterium]
MSETHFGRWLKQRRKALDLTQRELADQIGCAPITISLFETGQRRPSRQIVERLGVLLGLSPEERASLLHLARRSGIDGSVPDPLSLLDARQTPLLGFPTHRPALIGRAEACAELERLLEQPEVRLLTLTGPPGVGKTALALRVAAESTAYVGAACFVALAPVLDPDLVAATVIQTLGIGHKPQQNALTTLLEALRPQRLLLVLDNFEHVLGAAPLVAELLAAAPDLKVLVTSRAVLHLSGEHLYEVPPLALPPETPDPAAAQPAPAVELFLRRAQAVDNRFRLDGPMLAAIVALCRRLDGLPLAIELAAARCRALPPPVLLEHWGDQFALLGDGPRDAPTHQRDLYSTIAWSYALLKPASQRLFRHLAVFAGGWSLDAAVAVGAAEPALRVARLEVLRLLAELVDNSLVLRAEGDEPRWTVLETLRAFAWEQLVAAGEDTEACRRHALSYTALAEQTIQQFQGLEQMEALTQLDREYANLRAAMAWAVLQHDPEVAARLGIALYPYWEIRALIGEGRAWLAQILDQGQRLPNTLRARVLNTAGNLALGHNDYSCALGLLSECLAIYRSDSNQIGMCSTLNNLGITAAYSGDLAQAQLFYAEGLEHARTAGAREIEPFLLLNIAELAVEQLDLNYASEMAQAAVAAQRALGNLRGVTLALGLLGEVALEQGALDAALEPFRESLSLSRSLGYSVTTATTLRNLGLIATRKGEHSTAQILLCESLELLADAGDREGLTLTLLALAEMALGKGEAVCGAELVGVACAQRHVLRASETPRDTSRRARIEALLAARLGPEELRASWERGAQLPLEEVVAGLLGGMLPGCVETPLDNHVPALALESQSSALHNLPIVQAGPGRSGA